jgi:hypothetical protein
MSYSNTNQRIAQGQMGGSNRNSLKDGYVDLKVSKDATEKEVCIRLIGLPYAFTQHQAKTYNEELKKRVDFPFPDHEEKQKFSRNWLSPDTKDDRYPDVNPWAEAGYSGSLRYAQNVLVRNTDGSFSVKILEKGKMLFDQFTDIEKMNMRRNEQRKNNNLVTCLGGEVTHDIYVLAQFNPKKPLIPDLKVSLETDTCEITDEEIEALKKIGYPTEEELEELFAREPFLEELPRWFWYGYQLHRIYKPDLFPGSEEVTGRATTSRGELDMSDATNDDDEEESKPAARSTRASSTATAVAAKPASKPAAAKAAKAEVEETTEDESAFESEEPSEDDW